MIIWSGLGFLVAVIVFVDSLLAEIITETITDNNSSYQNSSIPLVVSLFISAVIIYFLGKWLNTRRARTFIDKETGREIILKNNHSLFFIRMEYWGIIVIVIATILLVKELFSL